MLTQIKRLKVELFQGIDNLVKEKKITYLEASVLYCENHGIDIEQAATIFQSNALSVSLLKTEADGLNFLKKGN